MFEASPSMLQHYACRLRSPTLTFLDSGRQPTSYLVLLLRITRSGLSNARLAMLVKQRERYGASALHAQLEIALRISMAQERRAFHCLKPSLVPQGPLIRT